MLDANGKQVTGGRSDQPFGAQVATALGSTSAPTGFEDAGQLSIWVPQAGADVATWSGAPLGTSTLIPPTDKKLLLRATKFDQWPLERFITTASGPSKGSVAGFYELRLTAIKLGPEVALGYFTADISIDTSTHQWKLLRTGPVAGVTRAPGVEGGTSAVVAGGASASVAIVTAGALGATSARKTSSAATGTPAGQSAGAETTRSSLAAHSQTTATGPAISVVVLALLAAIVAYVRAGRAL